MVNLMLDAIKKFKQKKIIEPKIKITDYELELAECLEKENEINMGITGVICCILGVALGISIGYCIWG